MVSGENKWALGVALACHKHNTWRVTWNSVTLYVLLVTLTPSAALTTSRTRLSDSLGLNNTFYCLVEPLQNIHFTCSSKIDSRLLQYVFECHVSWCSLHISQRGLCRGCVSHLNVISMEFNLNLLSKHLIEVDACNCTFVPFGWLAYVIKYSNLLGFYVQSICKWIPTDLSEHPTASTFWIKQSGVPFHHRCGNLQSRTIVTLFWA